MSKWVSGQATMLLSLRKSTKAGLFETMSGVDEASIDDEVVAQSERPMKGLLVPTLLHVFPTLAVGGQQTRFVTIVNWLGQQFRHYLVSLDGRYEAVNLIDPALDFTVLRIKALTNSPLRDLSRIVKLKTQIDANILITYNWGSIDWAIVNRFICPRPHIHLEDGFGPDESNQQKRRRVLTRRLFLGRSIVVVPSEKLVQIAQGSWHLRPDRVHYIPNGIDASRFDDIGRDGLPFFLRREGECIIGAFSPLRREKNLQRLIRAFSELCNSRPEVRLVICGDGPEFSELVELTARLKISDKVTFTGHVPKPEAIMGAFDLFAITSDTEQMPYAVLEAMAARLPIVATDVGDIKKMVATENRRFVVQRDDFSALVAALTQLCENGLLRRRIGSANRARVERVFTIDSMAQAFRKLLMEARPTA
jgi:glycosyltransferase involved in cell wall biosynthesis